MTKRLFIGTLLEPGEQQILVDWRAKLDPLFAQWWKDCQLRWVAPEKLHITWLFMGDCDAEKEKALRQFVENDLPEIHSLQLVYEQVEIFGNRSRPTAMVLTPFMIGTETQQLGKFLRQQVGYYCQNKDDFEFRPHLTLLRFPRNYRGKLQLNNEQMHLQKYLPFTQLVNRICLIESHMGSQKDSYEVIAEAKLSSSYS